jgi:hypothetical protein
MGYTIRPGTMIRDFWPDDDEKRIHLPSSCGHSLSYLIEKAKEKWPNATLDDIEITSEKIHTHCTTYDLYDGGDYTDFIIINYIGE